MAGLTERATHHAPCSYCSYCAGCTFHVCISFAMWKGFFSVFLFFCYFCGHKCIACIHIYVLQLPLHNKYLNEAHCAFICIWNPQYTLRCTFWYHDTSVSNCDSERVLLLSFCPLWASVCAWSLYDTSVSIYSHQHILICTVWLLGQIGINLEFLGHRKSTCRFYRRVCMCGGRGCECGCAWKVCGSVVVHITTVYPRQRQQLYPHGESLSAHCANL